jgi:REP element-mobilizing transposase RayT
VIQRLVSEVLDGQRKRKYAKDFRVLHFSIQAEHMHFVVEADSEHAAASGRSKRALRSGISGFAIAFARRLNMMLRRHGKVWADRYQRHDLRTPREVDRGLGYVFWNFVHHGERRIGVGAFDLSASGWVFDGWDGAPPSQANARFRERWYRHRTRPER